MLKKTYQFLAKYKRQVKPFTNKTFIPISHWLNDIKTCSVDKKVELLPEPVGVERASPPNSEVIMTYLRTFKNNTAPGNDKINIDLLKSGPFLLFDELANIIAMENQ